VFVLRKPSAIPVLKCLNNELVKASRAGDSRGFLQCKKFVRGKISMSESFRPSAQSRQ
jgi:hypothetical protein